MTDRAPFIRWFPASARSYIEYEIGKLVDGIPDQPHFVHDKMHAGDCFVLVHVTKMPPTANSRIPTDDQPKP